MKSSRPNLISRRGFLGAASSTALLALVPTAFGKLLRGAPKWDDRFELVVEFEYEELPGGRRYHRPYVAVFIEDKSGKSIRTLSLWVQTERRGPKWIPDLRRWFAGEQTRKSADGGDLVTTVSGATKMPGKYTLVWDGKTDKGAPVPQGEYFVNLEVAREHGTYQLIRQSVKVGRQAWKPVELTPNVEIKSASVEFRKRK